MIENLKQQWLALGAIQKGGLIFGCVAVLAFVVWLTVWALHNDYQILFADLDPRDGSTMVAELEKLKVPYRFADDGQTILVNKDVVHKTRLNLMSKGVDLKGTVGFEIFSNSDFGMTEFAQKINYQRALQGELARTIMAFDEIKFARVHLVLPESGLFRKNTVKPKASVTVVLKDGTRLRPEQVAGIQRLVAAAVSEMGASAVTVLDQQGVALTKGLSAESEAELMSSQLDVKRQTENYITKKVVEILDKTFGPGQAIVSVDVALDYDQVKVTREDVLSSSNKDGESIGVVSRKRQLMSGSPQIKDADISLQSEMVRKDAVRQNGNTTVEVEYQNGRRVEQIVSSPGGIKRLSVGVLLPSYADPSKTKKVADVIAMAVGLNPQRGDAIAVYSVDKMLPSKSIPDAPAASVPLKQRVQGAADAIESREKTTTVLRILAFLIAVITLVIAALLIRRFRSSRHVLTDDERNRTLSQIKEWLGGHHSGAKGAQLE